MIVSRGMRALAAGLSALLAAAAFAADEPEAVYRKLHNAAFAGNVDEMLKYSSAAQRAEISALPDRASALKYMTIMMPKSYAVTSKALGADGKSARILATGAHSVRGETKPMFGEISLRKEAGEWKVDHWGWSNERPDDEIPLQTRSPTPARASPGPPKPAAALKEPTLKRTEPAAECVFKPVMTEEDLQRCRR